MGSHCRDLEAPGLVCSALNHPSWRKRFERDLQHLHGDPVSPMEGGGSSPVPRDEGGKGYCPRPGRRKVFCFLVKGGL